MLQMSIQHKQPYFTWQLISRVSEVAATVLGSRETSERNRSNEETRRLLSLSLYSSVAMAPSSHYESDNSDAQRGPLALIVSSPTSQLKSFNLSKTWLIFIFKLQHI